MTENRVVRIDRNSFLITEIGKAEVLSDAPSVLQEVNWQVERYPRKGFDAQFRIHQQRVINGRKKEEMDTERVRNRKQTKIFRCASSKRRQEKYATIEEVALARKQNQPRNAFDNHLPREVTACDKRKHYFYWG